MLLAIRFFEPLFGALIVVPFFGLPPWLLRFKLFLLDFFRRPMYNQGGRTDFDRFGSLALSGASNA